MKFSILIFTLTLFISSQLLAKTEQVTIVFTAEMPEISGSNGKYAELATLLKEERKKSLDTFFYFGGGSLGPSILSSLDQGSHIIDLLNSLEPDAMGVSKREFSFYAANLSLRAYDAIFPIVATNILERDTGLLLDGILTSALTQHNKTTIGFLSIIDDSVIEEYTFRQISLITPTDAITHSANALRKKGADIVILHYSGYYPAINQLLDDGVIDLSLHKDESYMLSQYKSRVYHKRDIFVKRPQDAAIISLMIDRDADIPIVDMNWVASDVSSYAPDKDVDIQKKDYLNRLKIVLNVEIGITGEPLNTMRDIVRTGENSFGNYIADTINTYAGAELAIVNSGFIRGDRIYNKGAVITRGAVTSELPYRNRVVMIELTGQQVYEALENAFSTLSLNKGRFPQISGFNVIYDSSAELGRRVKSIIYKGAPINLTQKYRIATTDYLASGGDGYNVFRNTKNITDKNLATRLVSDIVMDKIIEDKIITPTLEGRIIDNNKKVNSNDSN